MKDSLIGFYRPSDEEFKAIWNKATFVLDANVLLNLYRYPSKARKDLTGALAKLSDRLWLPYQAALEFQRNRLLVIAEQKKKFVDVRNLIEETKVNLHTQIGNLQLKKRHSSIDVEDFLGGFENLTKTFLENLGKLDEAQRNVSDVDEMRAEIDSILSGKIGAATFDQNMLNDIYKQGEVRYGIEMPPGYMDAKKEKTNEPDSFQYGGLIYRRKFGDLILWKQLLAHAKAKTIKYLVLLTDDEKEDWWWSVESQGKKKMGPRPELVEEMKREGQVDFFYMYNSEQFLQYSKQYLQAEVSDESISQVREIRMFRTSARSFEDMQRFVSAAEEAVFEWLTAQHPASKIEINKYGFPDFVVSDETTLPAGYELKVFRDPRQAIFRLREAAYRAYYEVSERRLSSITIIVAMETIEALEEAVRSSQRQKTFPQNVRFLFGLLETDEETSKIVFRPVTEFSREKDLFDGA